MVAIFSLLYFLTPFRMLKNCPIYSNDSGQEYEAYDSIQARGRILAGGLSAGGSVSAAGGWVQDGQGVTSPKYGLGTSSFKLSDYQNP